MRPVVHYSLHGRPACRSGVDYGQAPVPPNTSTLSDEVTCKRCLRLMAKAAKALTPKKVRR